MVDISAFKDDEPTRRRPQFPPSGKDGWLMRITGFERKDTVRGDLLECTAKIIDEDCKQVGVQSTIPFFLWFDDEQMVAIAKRRFADLKIAVNSQHAENTSELLDRTFRGIVRNREKDGQMLDTTDVVKFMDKDEGQNYVNTDSPVMPPKPPRANAKSILTPDEDSDVPF